MSGIKTQWYKNGHAAQKRADITIDLRRLDVKAIQKMSPEQKKSLLSFVEDAKVYFTSFVQTISESCD